jgi:hypothetical protein
MSADSYSWLGTSCKPARKIIIVCPICQMPRTTIAGSAQVVSLSQFGRMMPNVVRTQAFRKPACGLSIQSQMTALAARAMMVGR